MKNNKNKLLVEALHKYIPDSKQLVNFLMDVLELNKESVYRRLRNEVPFTFEEICIFSPKLGVSLDRLVGLSNKENVFFDFHMHKSSDAASIYIELMEMNMGILAKVIDAGHAKMELVLNRLPFAYVLVNKTLAKFYYYKWCFQTQNIPLDCSFQDFHLPRKVEDIFAKHLAEERNLNCEINMLLDNNIFISFIKDINYFVYRELLNEQDVAELKQELLLVVDNIEAITRKGHGVGGGSVNLYISSIDLEPCHMYIEYDDKSSIHYWTSSGEMMGSYDPEICNRQKIWIQSLKRYTTLITGCNTGKSIEYFEKQRRYIKEKLLLSPSDRLLVADLLPPYFI